MPEAAPQYISPISPEPLPQTPDLSDRVGKIDNEAVRRKYEQLKPLNQLETLIKEGEKQLPTEPYSYEIYQIRDQVLHQAEQILKLKEDLTSVSLDELAEKLKTDYGAKKIEDLLYKPPWQSTEFDQSKANCQALWEKFTSQFSEAQAAAREWFENKYKIKIFRPEQGERFDPTLEEITQYSIIDLQTPTNPKSGIYISKSPGLMLGDQVIEKTQVELVESAATHLEVLAENYKLDEKRDYERRAVEELISVVEVFLSGKARFEQRTIPIMPTTYQEIGQALNIKPADGQVQIARHRGAVLNISYEDGHFVPSGKPGIADPEKSRVPKIVLSIEHQG
ncbi:MAG: hypothetical protein UT11_C0069G0006 [Berkelbacteria bacterium GW2011_GWA2_38_9]|uniref:Uncharacterized protein n=1 Tax=Berkelbacteria bacterium GW2011_GWA2_38_9 TaxID=1618334 RepID=A0A0G0L3G2_9BACT|nr:MAG: hypothetical protein UT11_C0069G0006 [Berkelbacteria bacterium GW2011_GWA2_38_9]